MKQYHFERGEFCDAFTRTFGEDDTIDFINGMFYGGVLNTQPKPNYILISKNY